MGVEIVTCSVSVCQGVSPGGLVGDYPHTVGMHVMAHAMVGSPWPAGPVVHYCCHRCRWCSRVAVWPGKLSRLDCQDMTCSGQVQQAVAVTVHQSSPVGGTK